MATVAEQAIADLDSALAESGSAIDIIALGMSAGAQIETSRVSDVPASSRNLGRGYQAHDLVGNATQNDDVIVISPTFISSFVSGRASGDAWLPRRGNRIIRSGETLEIEAVSPIRIAGQIVRIEIQARG